MSVFVGSETIPQSCYLRVFEQFKRARGFPFDPDIKADSIRGSGGIYVNFVAGAGATVGCRVRTCGCRGGAVRRQRRQRTTGTVCAALGPEAAGISGPNRLQEPGTWHATIAILRPTQRTTTSNHLTSLPQREQLKTV